LKNSLAIFGALLFLLGILGLAAPVFSTTKTEDVAKLGDLKVEAQHNQTHVIPPLLSEAAILVGVVLIGAGVVTRN
jgi:hypothetical protein